MKPHCLLAIIALCFTATRLVVAKPSHEDYLQCLSHEFRDTNSDVNVIYTPQNPSYAALLKSQNLRHERTFPIKPQLIVAPYHESEITAAMRCSKKLGLQIRVRSGGHDYEGLSHVSPRDPFVAVDMRNFRQVEVDARDKTAWVQVGATLGEFYHTIAQHGGNLAFPGGVCPTVGVGGHFSGGGYGMISRKHAIAADSIIDAKMIDSKGEILDRDSMGEDLFWAIRGGGGTSFGIFLAFKVKLVTVPEIVTAFNVSRTSEEKSTELVHKWQHIADRVDERLTIRVIITSRRSSVAQNKTVVASFNTLFLGRAHELLPIMQENFPELGLTEKDCTEMSWIESVLVFSEIKNRTIDVLLSRAVPSQLYFKGKSDFVKNPIPLQGLSEIFRMLNDDSRAFLQFSPYGGVLSTFSESETKFPHRAGNIYMIHYCLAWSKEEEGERKWSG